MSGIPNIVFAPAIYRPASRWSLGLSCALIFWLAPGSMARAAESPQMGVLNDLVMTCAIYAAEELHTARSWNESQVGAKNQYYREMTEVELKQNIVSRLYYGVAVQQDRARLQYMITYARDYGKHGMGRFEGCAAERRLQQLDSKLQKRNAETWRRDQ